MILSFEDRGKYITILALMHQQGRMDEETICLLVGSVSVKLKSKFSIDENGLFYNQRLEYETEKRNNFTESRRNNGLRGGRPKEIVKPTKKHKVNHKVKHKVNLMEDRDENVNIDVVTKESEFGFNFDFLEKSYEDSLIDFLRFRKLLKKPIKIQMSLEALYRDLKKLSGDSPVIAKRIVEQSIANQWQGIFELKEPDKLTAKKQPDNDYHSFYGTKNTIGK